MPWLLGSDTVEKVYADVRAFFSATGGNCSITQLVQYVTRRMGVLVSKPVLKPRNGFYNDARDENHSDSSYSAPQFPSNKEVLCAVLAGEQCADRLLLFVGAAPSAPVEEEELAMSATPTEPDVDDDDDAPIHNGDVEPLAPVLEQSIEDHSVDSFDEAELLEQTTISSGTFISSLDLEGADSGFGFSDLTDEEVIELIGGARGLSREPTRSKLMDANNFLRRRQLQNFSNRLVGDRGCFKSPANWAVWRWSDEGKACMRLWDVVQMQTVELVEAG